jgi:hypothetical protein
MLRVSFSSMTAARAAVSVLEAYGYAARQFGRDVVTDCPTLLAVPAIQKQVGLADIERLDLKGRSSVESMAELCPAGVPTPGEPSSQATA